MKLLLAVALFAVSLGAQITQFPVPKAGLLAAVPNTTVASSTTSYLAFYATSFSGTEGARQFPMPYACTASGLRILAAGTQSSTGTLVITLRKNGAATAITVTIPVSATSGTFSDTTHTVSFAEGDLIGLQLVNNATATSIAVGGASLSCN